MNETNSYFEYDVAPRLRYRVFDKYPELLAFFSTKQGGVSTDYHASMNLGFYNNDDRNNVINNHKIFAKACGYDYKKIIMPKQVHKTDIFVIKDYEQCGRGVINEEELLEFDGLVTNLKNIPLLTSYADCVPLYLYDPVKLVIGLAHSGWKGTVSKIGTKMVQKMTEEYNCNPKDIICVIGPSICKECYEVSADLYEAFSKEYSLACMNELFTKKENDKYLLDLQLACKYNFLEADITKDNIFMPDYCTCCSHDIFFSHRKTNGKRGNLVAVMMLK